LTASSLRLGLLAILGYVGIRTYVAPASVEVVDVLFGATVSVATLVALPRLLGRAGSNDPSTERVTRLDEVR
jgi:hypothetical protein